MNTKCTIAAFFLLFFLSGQINTQAQEATQQALIVKKTATWCSNCGSWGWTWFKDLIAATENSGGINIALHSTSSMLKPPNDLDGDWLNSFSTIGAFPTFFVNGQHYPSYSAVLGAAQNAVSQEPFAGVSLVTGFENDTIYAQGTVTWQEAGTGEYQVGFYIIQDSLVFQQSAQGANAIHRNVLREAMEDSHFGTPVNVSFEPGQTLSWDSKHYYPGISVDKHHVLAILWKSVGSKYEYVNGWMSPLEEGLISAVDQADIWKEMSIFPNPVQAGQTFTLSLPTDGISTSYRLFDVSGKKVQSGTTTFPSLSISAPDVVSAATFLLEISRQGHRKVVPVQVVK
jgi:hypothetical protein